MTAYEFKLGRKERGLKQVQAAKRLGVSQPYLALLESGKRKLTPTLVQKATRLFQLPPTVLPPREPLRNVDAQTLARQLTALGYPGLAYMRPGRKRNPAEVLLTALMQDDLESRLAEALPWLLLRYSDMDQKWLLAQARLRNLSNRLGFIVTLAKGVLVNRGENSSTRYQTLLQLADQLQQGRLDREDTLCQASLSGSERDWLRQTRPPEAAAWHLLTDWRPEHLQYASCA